MTGRNAAGGPIEAVAIGASAGGVEALSVILPALPAGTTFSVFVVLHLPRERPSRLVDIFAPKCAIAVREAQDKEPVAPGTIYFAPPDYHLLVDVGPQLVLSFDDLVHFSRPSVDVLFESCADFYAERVMGIVLTGANEDGSAGLSAIHEAGGRAVVQDPDTAQSPLMPQSALRRCPQAAVASVDRIAELLENLGRRHAV